MKIGDKVRILKSIYLSKHLQPDCVGTITHVYPPAGNFDKEPMVEVDMQGKDEAPFYNFELEVVS